MRNVRCPKCHVILGKEEEGKLILRTGYGKRRVFHCLKKEGTLTCWNCQEIVTIGGENEGKKNNLDGESGKASAKSFVNDLA